MIKKLIAPLAILVLLVTYFVPITYAEAPKPKLQDQPITQIVTVFAEQNGLDPKIALSVMQCESRGIQNNPGDGGKATGIYQYWEDTWERHSKEFGEELDINSPYDQAKLATWAIADGKGREWTAYRALMNGGKYTFYSSKLKKTITVYCKKIT